MVTCHFFYGIKIVILQDNIMILPAQFQTFGNGSVPLRNHTCLTEKDDRIKAALIETDFTLAAIYIGIMSVALLIGTFGNVMILIVVGWARGLNKVGKEFMVNLALADLCVSAVANPMCIVGVIKGEQFFNELPWLCQLIASLCLTACICAFMSLTMLSFNRYIYLCHNVLYDSLYGRKTCVTICILCWAVAFLCEFPNFIGWGAHHFDEKNHQCIWDRTNTLSYTLFVAVGLIECPLLMMATCYILIFRQIWNTKTALYAIDTGRNQRMKKVMKETVGTAKVLFVIFMVFFVCWTPYAAIIIIDVEDKLPTEVHLMVTLLAHLHSCSTFIVYFIGNKRFRATLARIWGCREATIIDIETKTTVFGNSQDKCKNYSGEPKQIQTGKQFTNCELSSIEQKAAYEASERKA